MADNKKAPAPAKLPAATQAQKIVPNAQHHVEKIDFDSWWASNMAKIPAQHRKEIILADMKGRGLSDKETAEAYKKALAQYGIKL